MAQESFENDFQPRVQVEKLDLPPFDKQSQNERYLNRITNADTQHILDTTTNSAIPKPTALNKVLNVFGLEFEKPENQSENETPVIKYLSVKANFQPSVQNGKIVFEEQRQSCQIVFDPEGLFVLKPIRGKKIEQKDPSYLRLVKDQQNKTYKDWINNTQVVFYTPTLEGLAAQEILKKLGITPPEPEQKPTRSAPIPVYEPEPPPQPSDPEPIETKPNTLTLEELNNKTNYYFNEICSGQRNNGYFGTFEQKVLKENNLSQDEIYTIIDSHIKNEISTQSFTGTTNVLFLRGKYETIVYTSILGMDMRQEESGNYPHFNFQFEINNHFLEDFSKDINSNPEIFFSLITKINNEKYSSQEDNNYAYIITGNTLTIKDKATVGSDSLDSTDLHIPSRYDTNFFKLRLPPSTTNQPSEHTDNKQTTSIDTSTNPNKTEKNEKINQIIQDYNLVISSNIEEADFFKKYSDGIFYINQNFDIGNLTDRLQKGEDEKNLEIKNMGGYPHTGYFLIEDIKNNDLLIFINFGSKIKKSSFRAAGINSFFDLNTTPVDKDTQYKVSELITPAIIKKKDLPNRNGTITPDQILQGKLKLSVVSDQRPSKNNPPSTDSTTQSETLSPQVQELVQIFNQSVKTRDGLNPKRDEFVKKYGTHVINANYNIEISPENPIEDSTIGAFLKIDISGKTYVVPKFINTIQDSMLGFPRFFDYDVEPYWGSLVSGDRQMYSNYEIIEPAEIQKINGGYQIIRKGKIRLNAPERFPNQ